jgi:hypothetical protein
VSTPETKRDRIVLNIKENHLLCNWLMEPGNIRAGDIYEVIAMRARDQLQINKINKDHVYTRMAALELVIPPAPAVDTDEELLQDIRDLRQVVLAMANMAPTFLGSMTDATKAAWVRLSQRSGV